MSIQAERELKFLYGQTLEEAINSEENNKKALVEGLLYEGDDLLFYADPGLGKTTMLIQMALQIGKGIPVFGQLHVPEPKTCLYIQGERHTSEVVDRIKAMSGGIDGIDYDRFIYSPDLKGFNLASEEGQDKALSVASQIYTEKRFDVAFIDPIYPFIVGGLAKEEAAQMFLRFSLRLKEEFGCTNVLSSHTNRGGRDRYGDRGEGDFYGSQWFLAQVTGAYHLRRIKKENELLLKKDSNASLLQKIPLSFNSETQLSYMPEDPEGFKGVDRLYMFLRQAKRDEREFTFEDMVDETKLSNQRVRQLMSSKLIKDGLKLVKSYRNKHFYQFDAEVCVAR